MARQVVLEIQANSGQAASALQEVEAKVSQLKQGFREAEEGGESAMNQVAQAASSLSGQITGTLQNAIDQTAKDFQEFGKASLQSFSRLEAATEDLQRRQELIGNSAEQVGQKIQNAYIDGIEAVEGLNRAQQNVFDELVERTDQGVRAVDSMEAAFSDLQKRTDLLGGDLAQAFEQGEVSIRQTGRAVDKFSGRAATMRSSVSATSNNLGFELTQAAQDAKFGMAGVANQIPLISRQFSDLTKKTGGLGAALKDLGSTFLGPVGIIAGLTLAATFLPDLISQFSSAEDNAEGFKEALDGTADSVFQLSEAAQEGIETTREFTLQLEEGLSKATDRLESQIANLRETQEAGIGGGAGVGGVGGAFTLTASDDVKALRERLDVTEESLNAVRKQIGQREALNALIEEQRRLINENTSLSAEQVRALQEEEASLQTIADAYTQQVISQEKALSLAEERLGVVDQTKVSAEELNDILEGPETAGAVDAVVGEVGETTKAARLLRSELETVNEEISQRQRLGLIDDTEAAEARLSAVEDIINRIIESDFDIDAEQFDFLRRRLEEAGIQLEQLKEDASDTESIFSKLREKQQEVLDAVQRTQSERGIEEQKIRDAIDGLKELRDFEREVNSLLAKRPDLRREEARQIVSIRRNLEETDLERPEREDPGSGLSPRQQVLGDIGIRSQEIERSLQAGLVSPLQAANQEVQFLKRQAQRLLDQGFDPNSEAVQDIVGQLEEAKTRAAALSVAFRGINQLAQGIGEQFAFTLFGDPERTNQLEQRRDQLQEQLRQARREGNVDQVRQLREELAKVNSQLNTASSLFGRMSQAIKNLGAIGKRILKQLTADLAAAAAKAAIITALSGPLGVSESFGSLFKTALIGRAEGGPVEAASGGQVIGPGGPTDDKISARLSDGEFVVNAASTQAAPNLVSAINDSPSFAKNLQQSLGGVQTFASGGFVNARVRKDAATTGGMPPQRSVRAGTPQLAGSYIQIPVEMVSEANRQGQRNNSRIGRA